MHRLDPIQAACEAIDLSEELTDRQKRFAKVSVRFRPLVRMRTAAAVQAIAEENAVVNDLGEVQAAFDWIEFLKLILPIILSFL